MPEFPEPLTGEQIIRNLRGNGTLPVQLVFYDEKTGDPHTVWAREVRLRTADDEPPTLRRAPACVQIRGWR